MNGADLPEPVRPNFSEEEKLERHWNLLVVFLTVVAGYAVLHKLIIPFSLSFTTLKGTSYAQIDWWFIHPVILAYFLHTSRRNTAPISLLAGVALVYGAYEIYEASQGRHIGWLMFSRLLSAVPLAIGSGYLMTQRRLGGDIKAAWLGAIALIVFFSGREIWFLRQTSIPAAAKANSEVSRQIPGGENQSCGAEELVVKRGTRPLGGAIVKIEECGFSPASLTLQSGTIEVFNQRPVAANVRLFIHEKGKTQSKWNILIPANSKASRELILLPDSVGMLISDSSPQAGIVGLVPPLTTGDWAFKRKPISIEEKN